MAEATARPSRVVVPQGVTWSRRLAAVLIYLLLRALAGTVRFRLADESGMFNIIAKSPLIFCTWHNRLSLSLSLYRKYFSQPDPGRCLAALVSASKDGGLLARIMEHFGAQPVRGSSSRRGPQALLELTSWAERGYDIAITPDGPRGPRYVVQEGVIALAQLTGRGILPVAYHLNWKICLKSWDRFQVPLPFATCRIAVGMPVFVPREASDTERAECRTTLETRMRALTRD